MSASDLNLLDDEDLPWEDASEQFSEPIFIEAPSPSVKPNTNEFVAGEVLFSRLPVQKSPLKVLSPRNAGTPSPARSILKPINRDNVLPSPNTHKVSGMQFFHFVFAV